MADSRSALIDSLPGLGVALGAGAGTAIGVAIAGGPGIVGRPVVAGAAIGLIVGTVAWAVRHRAASAGPDDGPRSGQALSAPRTGGPGPSCCVVRTDRDVLSGRAHSKGSGLACRRCRCDCAAGAAATPAGRARPARRGPRPPRRRGRTPPRRGCTRAGTVRAGREVGEVVDDPVDVDVGQAERADAGGVDDPAVVAVGQSQRDGGRRRVPAAAGRVVDDARSRAGRPGTRPLTRVLLPTPEWPTKTRDPARRAAARRASRPEKSPSVPRRHDVRDLERGVARRGTRSGSTRSALVRASSGLQAGVVGRDEAPVDHPRSRLRVGQRRDDDELVGVGDDDPLDGVGVVGRAAQHRPALLDAHDAGQAVRAAGEVADERDVVADDDALAAELARLHRRDDALGLLLAERALRDEAACSGRGRPPMTKAGDGVLVGRAVLGARPGPLAAGTDADVALVVGPAGSPAPRHGPAPSSMPLPQRRRTRAGSCASCAMSSTTTPGTRSPRTAPAIAMRWSA